MDTTAPLSTLSENQNGHAPRDTDQYGDSQEHLLAHLERIDLLIQESVNKAGAQYQADTRFQGLFVSEEEVRYFLDHPGGLPRWACTETPGTQTRKAHADLSTAVEDKERRSVRQGVELRLLDVVRRFGLDRFELDVLLIGLAPEFDLRYERVYAFLQDDINKKRPSIDLALNILCRSFAGKLAAWRRLVRDSALLVRGLIDLSEPGAEQASPYLSQYLKVDRRVVEYLIGVDSPAMELRSFAAIVHPAATLNDLILSDQCKERLQRCLRTSESPNKPVLYLHGPDGTGKRKAVEALCGLNSNRILVIDGEKLLNTDGVSYRQVVELLDRDLRLNPMPVHWKSFDRILEERPGEVELILEAMNGWSATVFLSGECAWEAGDRLPDKIFHRIEMPPPEASERVALWKRAVGIHGRQHQPDVRPVAAMFRLSRAQIEAAAATANHLARRRDPDHPVPDAADLALACRLHSSQRLGRLAQKITPVGRWQDLVLPAAQLNQLREVYNCVKYRDVVYDGWGFEGKIELGKGLNVLLAGPSGTGKTMSAGVLAGELGLDIYKVDLSHVVSKYIGETEKNLSRIFSEGSASNAILFFDEADALFGKRTEVKDSHDRHANVETGYLLQRIEEYEGVVVLASNFRNNLDEAFLRRIAFIISLPVPDKQDRLRIWQTIWPEQTPLADDLDFSFMAGQFKLTGGEIKNIALAAAFLAADDDRRVCMRHIVFATKRELEKAGRICVESDFGRYYPLIAA